MRFHDFHLNGYSVREFGREIVLHLVYDYPPKPLEESHIRFSDVELYHFVHTGGAIILDIEEIPLSKVLDQSWDRILQWVHQYGGVDHWDRDDRATYQAKLESELYRAWKIASAIGFAGFVIAKTIEDVTVQYHKPPNQGVEADGGQAPVWLRESRVLHRNQGRTHAAGQP